MRKKVLDPRARLAMLGGAMNEPIKVTYTSNNSGGSWWLTDQNWLDLEAAGWSVDWFRNQKEQYGYRDGRFLGALATKASRTGLELDDAISEWQRITGEDHYASGCPCCGAPHYFSTCD